MYLRKNKTWTSKGGNADDATKYVSRSARRKKLKNEQWQETKEQPACACFFSTRAYSVYYMYVGKV